jgi:hypothetical protein
MRPEARYPIENYISASLHVCSFREAACNLAAALMVER